MLDINEFYSPSNSDGLATLEIVNPIITDAKKLIIYGAGHNGIQAYRFLRKHGITPDFFCDAAVNKQGFNSNGIQVCNLDQLVGIDKDALIIISPLNGTVQIEKNLSGMGFHNFLFWGAAQDRYYRILGYMSDKDIKHKMAQDNQGKIDYVRGCLSDEKSRAVFEAVLQLWLCGDDSGTSRLAEKNEYFPEDIISLHDNEVFVDCGAYTGDTIQSFNKAANGCYNCIYSFEADADNYAFAEMTTALRGFERVHIRRLGIWDSKGTIRFESSGTLGSRITGDGGIEIPVDSLDNLFLGNMVTPTYIKMDIEGAEPNALLGAKQVIKTYRPKLAICVYHKFDHIWEIPYYISTNFPRYKLYLRQHNDASDTVLYAM